MADQIPIASSGIQYSINPNTDLTRMSKLTTYNVQRTVGHDLSDGLQPAVLAILVAIGVGSLGDFEVEHSRNNNEERRAEFPDQP